MEDLTDTLICKKKFVKTCLKILPPIVCFVAAPVIYLWAFDHASVFITMWGLADSPDSGWYLVPPLVAIFFGVAWSIFALVGWKHGNTGLKVGLSVVVWSFVTGVALYYWAGLLLGF